MRKTKIALLMSAAMLLSTVNVAAASSYYYYNDAYIRTSRPVTVVAGKDESNTARVTVEILEDGALANEILDVELSCGNITTASALHIKSDKTTDAPLDVVLDEDDSDYFIVEMPKETKKNDVIVIEIGNLSHPLEVDCDEIYATIFSRRGRFDESVYIADVIQPVSISVDGVSLKPALKDQVGGKITITENYRGSIEQGRITLTISDDYVRFSGTPKISTTENIKVSEKVSISKDGTVMTIDVIRGSSKHKGEIVIEDLVFSTSGATPNGGWYLDISGSSLCEDAKSAYWFKDFIVVTDKEPVVEPTFAIVTFMIDTPFYMVDKEMVSMDAAPYIAGSRTMMPIRYVSKALGIGEDDIYYAKGIVSIFHGENIIQMKVGDNVVLLNGTPILLLDTPATLVDGRVYIPVAQLKDIFRVGVDWDANYKTVTFKSEIK